MIKSIYLKDFAIIEEMRLDLEKGLSIFIGETGAGKSIIVGAIALLCGQRADTNIIRSGAQKAVIEGVFEVEENLKAKLAEYDIECEDELVIYRTVSSDAKNVIRVNNRTVTLGFLSDLMQNEIDIHSQKDSQYLLNEQNHLKLLDLFLGHDDQKKKVAEKYEEFIKLKVEYERYLDNNDSENDIDYYKYQIKEIDDARLDPKEEEELLLFEKRYKASQKLIEPIKKALSIYDMSVSSNLYQAIKELNIDAEDINPIKDRLSNSYYDIEDSFDELRKIFNSFAVSESEINKNEERLYTINRLKRKYKGEIEAILALKEELIKRVQAYENRFETLDNYEKNIADAKNEYRKQADILHELRVNAALKLRDKVLEEVKELELKYFDFEVSLNETEMSKEGYDAVSFMISTNRGEALRPLVKTASGGEMSRIMLALKAVFTKISGIHLAIFDEIDTGVSGKAALAIGKKMAKIAKYSDVLAITHLAQVAAFADNLYFVKKDDKTGRTTSSISKLDDEMIVKELALMANASTNQNALNSISDLIAEAAKEKKAL